MLFICGCAGDPAAADADTAVSDPTTTGSTTGDPTAPQATATAVDLGAWPFCAPSPDHQDLDDQSWLFRAKYRTQLLPGTYPVVSGGGLPYALEVHGESTTTTVVDDDRNEFAVVPGRWHYADVGFGSGEILDDPGYQSLVFEQVFQLESPIVEPWREDPLSEIGIQVITSMPVAADTAEFIIDENAVVGVFRIGGMAACGDNRPAPAVTYVELAEGEVTFETIPGMIATRAVGALDGIAIDVANYFELDCSGWRPGGGYLDDPMFGVRLPTEGPSGECALYVFLPNDADNTLSDAEAWWLDCDGARLRELEVTAFDIVFPGG